jgi:hypothetical protein
MPIMLQQGFELLAGKFLILPRASLALGYIPMSWRHTRVVYSIITVHFSQLLLSHQLNPLFILKNTIWFLKMGIYQNILRSHIVFFKINSAFSW